MDTKNIFDELLESGQIEINKGSIFDKPVSPKSRNFNFDRIEGMMLGLAIGDSLGITSEGKLPQVRKEIYGEITDYLPNKYSGLRLGYPSDDTQLAFWALEQMIHDKGFNPKNIADKFCQNKIFGIGRSVRTFLKNYKISQDWKTSAPNSAGNGCLMRIAPMCIPYLKSGGSKIWIDTALCTMITHNDSLAISSCVAFIYMLWELLDMEQPPSREWWLKTYISITKEIEKQASNYSPRGGNFVNYEGNAWKYIEKVVTYADEKKLPIVEACNSWYSGAYLLETVPCVLYILMNHADNPEEAIIRAVNDTRDNDTIGAIVGAAIGALHGKRNLPDRWIKNHTGRTTDRDDGKIFEILKKSKEVFWC